MILFTLYNQNINSKKYVNSKFVDSSSNPGVQE